MSNQFECLQRNLHCNDTEIGSLERAAQTIAKGFQQSKTSLTKFLNTFLIKVPDRYFNSVFGGAVNKYVMFIIEHQLRKLHSLSSLQLVLPYEDVCRQRQSTEELKTTAAVSKSYFPEYTTCRL